MELEGPDILVSLYKNFEDVRWNVGKSFTYSNTSKYLTKRYKNLTLSHIFRWRFQN